MRQEAVNSLVCANVREALRIFVVSIKGYKPLLNAFLREIRLNSYEPREVGGKAEYPRKGPL